MPQFDATTILDPIKVRLLPYADFDGIIPEPSDADIGAFIAGIKELSGNEALARMGLVPGADMSDPEQAVKAAEGLDPEEFVKAMDRMTGLFALLTGGQPTKEQIQALPIRKRIAFFIWLQSEVMRPEAETPAGDGEVTILPSPAGGSSST
jgi:hypothetical protein